MKKQRTVRVKQSKLNQDFKFVSKGNEFVQKSVCQLKENLGDGTGWFIGLGKGGNKNTIKCEFDKFDIFTKDGNIVEIQGEF